MKKAMISQLQSMQHLAAVAAGKTTDGKKTATDDFLVLLQQSLAEVNNIQQQADRQVNMVQSGQSKDILGAVVTLEKADLSFQLLLQVRNKAVKAYEEIMRMQL